MIDKQYVSKTSPDPFIAYTHVLTDKWERDRNSEVRNLMNMGLQPRSWAEHKSNTHEHKIVTHRMHSINW